MYIAYIKYKGIASAITNREADRFPEASNLKGVRYYSRQHS